MKAHKLSELFPSMKNLTELAEDIKSRGQIEDIVTYQGKILDGNQRYAACKVAGVDPRTVTFESLNGAIKKAGPLAFVASSNLHRRHLSTLERIQIAAKIAAEIERENNYGKVAIIKRGPKTRKLEATRQAAAMLNVSERSVRLAKAKPKKRKAEVYKPDPNAAHIAFREGWKPSDEFPGTDLTYQTKWRQAIINRANASISMNDEDWSMYKADSELVNVATQALESWKTVVTKLRGII